MDFSNIDFARRAPLKSDQKAFRASIDPMKWYAWVCDVNVINCEECAQHDGKIFRGKDLPDYPVHDWCHCKIGEVSQDFVVASMLKNK